MRKSSPSIVLSLSLFFSFYVMGVLVIASRLWNDQYCVECVVKLYSLNHWS